MSSPASVNVAELTCERHARATPDAPAVIEDRGEDRAPLVTTFGDLDARSEEAAGLLAALGVRRGEPVAVHLPQSAEMLAFSFGALKLGAVAMPLAQVLGRGALDRCIRHSGAHVLVTDLEGTERLGDSAVGGIDHVVVVDGGSVPGGKALPRPHTTADSPAFLLYTSGTSGPPKGVVLAHRMLLAQVPGFRRVFELAPRPGDIYWTPSEWSWLGGLQVVLVALYFGYPVVASKARFSAAGTYRLVASHGVTCAFLAPAALRKLRAEPPETGSRLLLRAIMTGGESYSPEVLDWAREAFSCPVNDDYGLTEANDLAVSCASLFATPDGAAGRPVPGRRVAVIDDDGKVLGPLAAGEIALAADDPIRMLGYWNGRGCEPPLQEGEEWFRTGDLGHFDRDGFLFVHGRGDDLILVSGYRVGPGEVESELLTHEAVADAGVVGIERPGGDGKTVGACVVLRPGVAPCDELADELKALVRERVAAYAYPRVVIFVDELPVSTNGKLRRDELRRMVEEALAGRL